MYGSSLRLVTRTPREARIAASDAAAMPFPNEETTPPVTNTNLVMAGQFRKFVFYAERPRIPSIARRCTRCDAAVQGTNTTTSASANECRKRSSDAAVKTLGHARPRSFATDELEHRIDRGRLQRAGDERAKRHHQLRRLETVARSRSLDRRADRFARPVERL